MKLPWFFWLILFLVIAGAALLANLLALKIASDQVQGQLNTNPLLGFFARKPGT